MQLRRFAVIGHPIGHTMSPFIHDRLFSLTGYKPEYSVLDVPSLTQALPALRTLDGFNITIPPQKRHHFPCSTVSTKKRSFSDPSTPCVSKTAK